MNARAAANTGRRFWNEQGQRYSRSFFGAPTTRLYREEEQALLRRHLGSLHGVHLLKLDLWNEAQNTEILLWAAREGATCYGVDIAETTVRKARARGCAPGADGGVGLPVDLRPAGDPDGGPGLRHPVLADVLLRTRSRHQRLPGGECWRWSC